MTTPAPGAAGTAAALDALGTREVSASTLPPSLAQRAVDTVTGWLSGRTSRRGFLVRAGVVGTALATDPFGYVLKPGTAYASVCGPGSSCTSGWTVFCATILNGVNACPPGSIAAGWWKADGASLCGGQARYIIDCNARCSRCSSSGARPGICHSSCWSCGCTCGPTSSCDQRRVCCNAFRYGQCNTHVGQVGGVQCRVVSCTPPWRFENCSTSPATDNRTRDHSSDRLPTAFTAITRHYMSLGENGSPLGATRYGEFSVPGGRAQMYQAGRISWHPSLGAHDVRGKIGSRYNADGYEAGRLGFPITGTARTPDGGGWFNDFQRGRITMTPLARVFLMRGGIAGLYRQLGAEAGVLGHPASDELKTGDGKGRFNWFERGRIWWYPNRGIKETRGPIDRRYYKDGSDRGRMGLPATGEIAAPGGGAYNLFQGGRITRTPEGSAFLLRFGIAWHYADLGAEGGVLGYPASDELKTGDGVGRFNWFQRGRIWWYPGRGILDTRRPIDLRYWEDGSDRRAGGLGLPRTSTRPTADGLGQFNRFDNGRITQTPTGAVWIVRGPIARHYEQLGAESSSLGYPTSDEYYPSPGLRRSDFQRGRLTYDESTGQVTQSPL